MTIGAYAPDLSWCERGGARDYIATRQIVWVVGKSASGWHVTVPEGREFESSVPRCLRWLWSPYDPFFVKAAAVHDVMLETGFSRATADAQWFEVAISEGAPPLKVWLGHFGMRGRRFWLWAKKSVNTKLF
jgi:hypothetical protein